MPHARKTCSALKQVRTEKKKNHSICVVVDCFFSNFSFDLISCTVYKLNLMSFSIAAALPLDFCT